MGIYFFMWDSGKMLHVSINSSIRLTWCSGATFNESILIRGALRDIFYQGDDSICINREAGFSLKSNSLNELM